MDFSQIKIRNRFPIATPENTRKTSEPDRTVNCFGYAMGLHRTVYHIQGPGYYWPRNVARGNSLDCYEGLFASIGYEKCADGVLELGFEKIAIYATSNYADHAARQKPNGRWTSKLGDEEDIEHDTPEAISGGIYGRPLVFMKRPSLPPATQP